MKTWHLVLILVLLLLSLGFTAHLSDEKYYSTKGMAGQIIETKKPDLEPSEDEAPQPVLKGKESIITEDILETDETTKETNLVYVEIKDMEFVPKELTIPANTTVIWINKDWTGFYGRVHMVVSSNNQFRSSKIYYNKTFNVTFTELGEYKYLDPTYRSDITGGVLIPPGMIYVE